MSLEDGLPGVKLFASDQERPMAALKDAPAWRALGSTALAVSRPVSSKPAVRHRSGVARLSAWFASSPAALPYFALAVVNGKLKVA
jgi:hypothetical protein